jgi:D-aminopeptidase
MRTRARELGIVVGSGQPGPINAITDVDGVRVGHMTLVYGEGPLTVGKGPVRTGVTVVEPRSEPAWDQPCFAGWHRLNGNGELSGLHLISECGVLTSPIGITNTHSLGVVRDALVAAEVAGRGTVELYWSLPVVGETWDGMLNDICGQHVTANHVHQALAAAARGSVAEGNVGGGTGMICHGFKGGIGTASRVATVGTGTYTVGVLVQANHGRRERLAVNGVPVGQRIGPKVVPLPSDSEQQLAEGAQAWPGGAGSIIAIVATDAPLLPHQCTRLAQRAALGVARTGGAGEHSSGDLFLAFATSNRDLPASSAGSAAPLTYTINALGDAHIDPLFYAAVEATEEAILNALLRAETMTGRDGITAHALPADILGQLLA